MKKLFLLILLLFIQTKLFAFYKEYEKYSSGLYLERSNSTKSESMGRTLVANNDGVFTILANPAGNHQLEGFDLGYSHSSPVYLAEKAFYHFLGINYGSKEYGVIGLSWYHYSLGEETSKTTSGINQEPEKYTPGVSLYTFNYAKSFGSLLAVGVNFNIYQDKLNYETATAYPVDLGIKKTIQIIKTKHENRKMHFGLSIQNITNVTMDYYDMFGTKIKNGVVFPVILRAGTAYQFSFGPNTVLENRYKYGFLLNIEYEDVLNYSYKTAFKAGGEFSFLDLLFIRMGVYSLNMPGGYWNKDRVTDITYGAGINLPIEYFVDMKYPLNIVINYLNMKQPSYIVDYDKWGNYSTFSINIVWKR